MVLGWACLAGCAAGSAAEKPDTPPSPSPQLLALPSATPVPAVTPRAATSTPPPTYTPTATPTPVTYAIKKGDTLVGIAYNFGISVDALQAANPTVRPGFLTIGALLTIPVSAESVAASVAAAATPTPQPVTVAGGPACYPLVTGALYCLAEVRNPGQSPLENVAVQIALVGQQGETLASGTALAALEVLPPGGAAPLAVLFPAAPPRPAAPVAQVLSANAGETAGHSLALDVTAAPGAAAGALWTVTGQVHNPAPAAATVVKLVVTLYDREGKVLGYRQMTLPGGLAGGAAQAFSISAAPLSGVVDHSALVAEGKP